MSALKSAAQGPIFIGLNVLRALSMIGLLLVFIANIVTLVGDGEAIREDRTAAVPFTAKGNSTAGNSTTEYKCDYIFNSTIPDQAGGAFWSVLNRVFIRELSDDVKQTDGKSWRPCCSLLPRLASRASCSRPSFLCSDLSMGSAASVPSRLCRWNYWGS